jgi:hypothetical protein
LQAEADRAALVYAPQAAKTCVTPGARMLASIIGGISGPSP